MGAFEYHGNRIWREQSLKCTENYKNKATNLSQKTVNV